MNINGNNWLSRLFLNWKSFNWWCVALCVGMKILKNNLTTISRRIERHFGLIVNGIFVLGGNSARHIFPFICIHCPTRWMCMSFLSTCHIDRQNRRVQLICHSRIIPFDRSVMNCGCSMIEWCLECNWRTLKASLLDFHSILDLGSWFRHSPTYVHLASIIFHKILNANYKKSLIVHLIWSHFPSIRGQRWQCHLILSRVRRFLA